MRVVRSLVALAGLTLCMLAKPSEAGMLEVRFALGGGQISLAVAGFGSSNLQTMFTGTARVVLTGVDALGEITDRAATASLFDVDVLVNLTFRPWAGPCRSGSIRWHQRLGPSMTPRSVFPLRD